jgi:hypothetical protein
MLSVLPANLYVDTSGSARVVSLRAIVTNDPAAAGVNWSVSCSASSCGSITPQTASGVAANYQGPAAVPPGGAVTITASSVTNPAVSATAQANIVTSTPIAVQYSSAPPATLTAGSPATLIATVAGDPNSLGVNWTASCGTAGACGAFNLSPAHTATGGQITYTAPAAIPAGAVVTITASSPATTPANAAVALTTIVAPSPSISLTQGPPGALVALAQVPVSATVNNDVSPGGVNWSVQCGSTVPGGCGWILPVQTASGATATYNAPPVTAAGTSVTITATSVANPSASVSSCASANACATTISPNTTPSVSLVPSLPSQMGPNATVNLTAAVANDTTNAGVDWSVCASGCGFFTVTPAIPAIPATATTPYVPPVAAVTATTVFAWPNGLPIPYTAPSAPPTSGMVAIGVSADANHAAANSGTVAIGTDYAGPGLNGLVQAGSQAVKGALVSLYAAGTSGYASAASQIATASTNKNGEFTMPAGYACPAASSQMYLVAAGGSVGANSANPNLALMTALGSCSNLSSSPVVVNEVTTIGSVYATTSFAANDALTGNSSYLYLGTSSGNLSGLANAFAATNNLVNVSNGQANFVTPAGNAPVPYAEINTLADILDACAASSGGVEGDASACGTLFYVTDMLEPETFSGSVGPTDTLQAVFNLAQHPVANYGYGFELNSGSGGPLLFGLASSKSPFQPILASDPSDWSLSLNYTGGGGLSSASAVGSFAVDATGNLWITDSNAGRVIEWNPTGAALSLNCPVDNASNSGVLAKVICNPPAGYPAGGGPIAIDANENVWISGNGVLRELTHLGTPVPGSPFGGVVGGGGDIAIDAQGNLWIANGGGVSEFDNLGADLSPAGGFAYSGIPNIDAVGIDSSNDVWIANHPTANSSGILELTNPGAQLISPEGGLEGVTVLTQMAADREGNIWVAGANICQTPPFGGNETLLLPTCWAEWIQSQQNPNPEFYNAGGVALDGAGMVWMGSQGGGPLSISPGVLPILSAATTNANLLESPSLSAGPLRVAVDGSGNVWVLLANDTVTEYVGVATPVVTPIALGVKNGKLAAKP